jgi:protein-tyrosine-phosphatase
MVIESYIPTAGASIEARVAAFAALGDPVRLQVMDLIALNDLSPDALADALGIQRSLLAHHLNVLEEAGLIQRSSSQHDRRRVYVRQVPGSLHGLLPREQELVVPRVVFVCTRNTARSVLAEGLWRAASNVPTGSAGTHPAEAVHPGAVAAARRARLSLPRHRPRHVKDVIRSGDLVVSVCDTVNEELGPVRNRRLHWSIPDPVEDGRSAAFDAALESLRERIADLAPAVRSTSRR